MRTYSVLIYSGQPTPPALHLVTAADTAVATALADELLAHSSDAVGVEVVLDGARIYARGAVPSGVSLRSDSPGDQLPD